MLKNRYQAIAVIGQGGFGKTFLAIDGAKTSRPHCVIKQFLPIAQGTHHVAKAAELFEQEAKRLEELGSHPQIPALLAYFSQDNQQYLVQEFIEGKNLEATLQTRGAFSEAQVLEVLTSLLPVLKFIHAAGVIHRDIKPANLIATPDRTVVQPQSHLPNWTGLLSALAQETAQGFRAASEQFSQYLSQELAALPMDLPIADYRRCQQMGDLFSRYSSLTFSQRQYLVADASRLLYELRQKNEQNGQVTASKLVLVDFGAAKSVKGSSSKTGTAIGSPEYLAPEQARGKAVFASDLYSLGVTCIHLLTNVSPLDLFDTHEDVWVWQRYLKTPISDRLRQILDTLIQPGTNRRYATVAAVLQDLKQSFPLLSAPSAPSSTAPSFAAKPSRRKAVSTWQCTRTIVTTGKVHAIALSPSASILASTSGTVIRLWDWQTGQPLRNLTGHLDVVSRLMITPDGSRLISGSADKTIRLWELSTGQRLGSLNFHRDTVLALALNATNQTLASSSVYDPIVLLDLNTGQEKAKLFGQPVRTDALAFNPNGSTIASGSDDHQIHLWNVELGTELQTLQGHRQLISTLCYTPDGKTLVSGSWDGTVKLWSTVTHRVKRTLLIQSDRIHAVAISPDGKILATGSNPLKLWQSRTGKEVATLSGHTGGISAIVFSQDSKTLISSSWDGTIRVWQFKPMAN